MKKLAFAAALLIAAVAASCSNKADEAGAAAPAKKASAEGIEAGACNFRYMSVDSIFNNYTLAKEIMADQEKEMKLLESTGRQKEAELQRMATNIETKARNNGYLTEQSYNSDMQTLQQRQQEANQWLNTSQERIALMQATNSKRLNDSLQNFLKDYNAEHGYDAIFDRSVGFFNPALDITDEIIEGLNNRYKGEAKATK